MACEKNHFRLHSEGRGTYSDQDSRYPLKNENFSGRFAQLRIDRPRGWPGLMRHLIDELLPRRRTILRGALVQLIEFSRVISGADAN